jgi:uncharacterized protein YndB with AHSA1/START domain
MTTNLPLLTASTLLKASRKEIWDAWTTAQGIKSFLAPDCKIDFRVGGAYEIYFDPQADPKDRGSIGSVILAIQPLEMFSFSWCNPPSLPEIRWQYTHVTIRIREVSARQRQVILLQDGWGSGEDWEKAYQYFRHAWQEVVMSQLVKRFEIGSINWDED